MLHVTRDGSAQRASGVTFSLLLACLFAVAARLHSMHMWADTPWSHGLQYSPVQYKSANPARLLQLLPEEKTTRWVENTLC